MNTPWKMRFGTFLVTAVVSTNALAQSATSIVIDGSTGVMPLARALASAFQAVNPDVAFQFGKGLGTRARIDALAVNKIDIALASHGLDLAAIKQRGLAAHEVARTAVVFGVNASVPLRNLTDSQICDVYAGKIANWQALGGPDLAVAARTRPDTEVDTEVVRANVACLTALQMPPEVTILERAGDMGRELAGTAGAIGMTSMTLVEQSQGKIRELSLNGIAPSADNVTNRNYPLVREAFFVMSGMASPAVTRFLDFVKSRAGMEVIRKNGAIPAG